MMKKETLEEEMGGDIIIDFILFFFLFISLSPSHFILLPPHSIFFSLLAPPATPRALLSPLTLSLSPSLLLSLHLSIFPPSLSLVSLNKPYTLTQPHYLYLGRSLSLPLSSLFPSSSPSLPLVSPCLSPCLSPS